MHQTKQREACCHGCCPNPLIGYPGQSQPLSSSSVSAAAAARSHFEIATTALFPDSQFTNHESLPSLHESFSNFNKVFPHYSDTDWADRIREQHYFHLSLSKHVCFDYTGHGLFSYSQLKSQWSAASSSFSSSSSSFCPLFSELEPPFFDICCKSVSLNSWMQDCGEGQTELESRIRKRVTAFMNISEDDYTMVFTANQSSAFKLLAESYPFSPSRKLVTVYDYENEAVQLMSESAKKRGARVVSAEFSWPDLRIQSRKLMKKVLGKKRKKQSERGMFVFPPQSRMSGARYSYQWMSLAQEHGWHVLLDASALGAKDMDTLGLSLFRPDFLFCSFYKIFGENPSGFGCLFIKKSIASVFIDSSVATAIGIASLVPSTRSYQFSQALETEQKTESQKDDDDDDDDQTENEKPITKHHRELSFSEILELDQSSLITKSNIETDAELECKGLDDADKLGLILISNRARYLINWLVHALMSLQYPHSDNRLPLVRIYGPKVMFDRGPAIAFNVFDWKGEKVDPKLVQRLADRYNISLSYGFLGHIWFSDKYEEEKKRVLETRTATKEAGMTKRGEAADCGISVVTAAVEWLTNFEDTYRLWAFVSRFLDADFVQKERWRYLALNQQTIEI